MIGAAACLKVQINDDLPVIQSYIDTNNNESSEIQYEQIAVFSLLYPYFMVKKITAAVLGIGTLKAFYQIASRKPLLVQMFIRQTTGEA